MPLIGDPSHASMVEHMSMLNTTMPKPAAILIISAHWEEAQATLSTGDSNRKLMFDYSGFPPETYSYTYAPPRPPQELVERTITLLKSSAASIPVADTAVQRGFDHGKFPELALSRLLCARTQAPYIYPIYL